MSKEIQQKNKEVSKEVENELPKEVPPAKVKLKDGPLATLEAGRVEKEEAPKEVIKDGVAPLTAERDMFKNISKDAESRGKKAHQDPITGVIVVK